MQLYQFLARRTGSSFNKTVLKRLMMSKNNRPPMGLNRVLRYVGDRNDKVVVVVGTVTDDARLAGHTIKPLRLCALRVTEAARDRIVAAGGEVLTFDQLALAHPTGTDTVLLRGRRSARTSNRYWGKTGEVRPRTGKGSARSRPERARGRRNSRGFKV